VALVVIGAAWAVVRSAGVRVAVRLFSRQAAAGGGCDWDRVRLWVHAIESAAARLPAGTCLPQALALQWLLARQQCGSEIRIGLRRQHQLEAHAWVEVDGVVVLGGAVDSFAPIATIHRRGVSP